MARLPGILSKTMEKEEKTEPDMEERVAELEIRLTFQEKLVEELNEVIIQQQKQLDALQQDFAAVKAKVRDLPALLAGQGAEPPPPHY